MINQTVPTERVTCDVIGRAKLLAEITPTGLNVWCKICKTSHFIDRARVMRAWERGESVQCEVASGDDRV
jgi:hypothetical protein